MTRAHKGNYRAKHPESAQVADSLRDAVAQKLAQGPIACKTAFAIAQRLSLAPMEVGKAIDIQQGRIHACQLGLFGYGAKDNRLQNSKPVCGEMETAIQKAIADGRLRCLDAWSIADSCQLKRIEVARACEAMKVKIRQCQLGAF